MQPVFAIGLPLVAALCLLPAASALAQGTISYYQPPEPLNYAGVPFPPFNYREIDVNSDGIVDFVIAADPAFATVAMKGDHRLATIPEIPPDLGSTLFPFAYGAEIGVPLSPAWSWEGIRDRLGLSHLIGCFDIGCIGPWQGVNAYVGIELQINGNKHYGWIHLANDNNPSGRILDWAYETRPNTPIRAGAKPVPVPLAAPQVVRPGQLRLAWPAEINKAYQIQCKENLSSLFWTNLNFTVIGTTSNAAVDIPITGTAKFFRVVEAD